MSAPEPSPPQFPDRVATGAEPLDRLLGGGLESDALTEVYGEGGTGKSVWCIGAAVRTALADRWVFYLDTEGLSTDRLAATSGGEPERVLRRLLLATPKDLPGQAEAVHTACALARDGRRRVGLIVLDSATLHYRLALGTSAEEEARASLLAQLSELLATSIAVHVPVVFTNQVYRSVGTGALEPIGGSFLGHLAKTVLRFERPEGGGRRAVLVKHRALPERTVPFRITERGIE